MFFFATKSFMYSLSLSWMSSQPTGRRGLCAQGRVGDAKRGTYQLYLLDLFLQLSVLSLVLDILSPRGDAGDVTLVLLLCGGGGWRELVVHGRVGRAGGRLAGHGREWLWRLMMPRRRVQ